jgi:hypothetical protein
MRICLALALATALAGCGKSNSPAEMMGTDGGGDDGGTIITLPDADLRPTLQLNSPTLDIAPGTDLNYCYYFHTSNQTDLAIQQWESSLSDGAADMVVFLTRIDRRTPGTTSTDNCGFKTNGGSPTWAYSSQAPMPGDAPPGPFVLPANDGTGMPVAQIIPAGQPGFLQMHLKNTTGAVIHAHVEVTAKAYPDDTQVTPAGTFVTYNTQIDLSPGSAGAPTTGTVTGKCTVSASSKFFAMSAHTFQQGTHTTVTDGTAFTAFDGVHWQTPSQTDNIPATFYSFTSGKLSYQCDYLNPNNYRIQSGDSPASAENCMAVGYFFPSPGSAGQYCLDSAILN